MHAIATENTISRSIDSTLRAERPLSPELFAELRSLWKEAAKAKSLSSASLAAWAIIRGADPRKGFAPVTNAAKLANGQDPWAARDGALRSVAGLSRGALEPWAALLSAQGAALSGYSWKGDHPLLALLASPRA